VRFSRARGRYERQGMLVEEQALERAGEDIELQTRMAEEIVRLFPGCPPDRARSIAGHTSLRGSGRVVSLLCSRAKAPVADALG
jgi:hypothetical protein